MNHPTSSAHYDTHTIRQLLLAAFSDEEFTIFCYDYFPTVYREFTIGMTFSAKVQLLIAECASSNFFETLLELVQKSNPNQYAAFAPALQSACSASPNIPAKLSRAGPPEKWRAAGSRPAWPAGCLMLAVVLLLTLVNYIFYTGLVAPRPAEPLSLSFEPTGQLGPQPAPEPLPLSTPAGIIEPAHADFIEPTFEPALEVTTEPMPEPIEELWFEPTIELVVETTTAAQSELPAELITEPAEGWAEADAELPVESTSEWTVEPIAEPTDEPTEEASLEPTAEPTEEATPEPTEEPTEEPTPEPTSEPTEEATPEPIEEPGVEPGFIEPITEFIVALIAGPSEESAEELTPEPTEEIAEH